MVDIKIWKNIVDKSLEPILFVEKKSGKVKYANQSAVNIFPQLIVVSDADIYLQELNDFSESSFNNNVFELISSLSGGESINCNVNILNKECTLVMDHIEREGGVLVRLISDSPITIIEDKSGLSCDYRDILTLMLEGVNQVPYTAYNDLLTKSLKDVGEYFKSDRVYVFNYSDDERFVSMTAQWAKTGIVPFSDWKDMPLVHFSHVGGHLLNNKVFCINEMNNIPVSAIAERHGMMAEGVKSVLLVSYKTKNHTLGFIGIDMVSRERRWTADEVEKLKFFSALVANLQVKQRDYLYKSFQESMSNKLFEESVWATGIFKDNVMVDCNNQVLALLKGKKHDIIGKTIFDFTYAENEEVSLLEKKLMLLMNRSKNGKTPVGLWDIQALDGSVERVELTFQTFEFEETEYVAISAKDIKEQIEKEEKLKKKQKRLESKLDTLMSPSKKILKVKLLDLLNKEQLFTLTKAFSDATGLASAIIDENGSRISSISSTNDICDLIRSTRKGEEICQMSDLMLNTKIKASMKPEWHHCLSCSFLDAAAPIVVDGELVGTWWIGRALPYDADINRGMKFGVSLGIDEERLSSSFAKQKRISKKGFEKSLYLLKVLANELSNLAYNNLKLAKAIKAHQRMEKRLEKARVKAEESDRLKSAFLANMSHEIRTPMNGIIGFTDLIRNPEVDNDDREKYISIIQESSNQLLNIINDIIDISKIEAGQIEAKYEQVRMTELLNELVLFYGLVAKHKGIVLILECDLNDDVELYADRTKLKQVFSNLIGNAIKFTSSGYVKFGCVYNDNKQFEFFVEDTGFGISAEDQKQIFNRFWQVGANANNSGGTGLGLTITKAYVELMEGKIWLESELEQGTVFKFVLPEKNI